jgi:5-hydroxyisourate hydrolase
MKNAVFLLILILSSSSAIAQEKAFQLSTHVLDISEGMPAANVTVKLGKMANSGEKWQFIA